MRQILIACFLWGGRHCGSAGVVYRFPRQCAGDPTLAHIIKTPGKAFACSEYLSDADVAASRFHSEFMIPNGIRYVLSGVVSMQGSMVSFFGFQRHISQPPFSQIEADFLQRLIPHFAKADQVAARPATTVICRPSPSRQWPIMLMCESES